MALTDEQFSEVSELLTDALNHRNLSEWEKGFVADFNERLHANGERMLISARQWDVLERLKGKVYGT